ncbi:hypothetical protein Tco_1267770 [Tanacetum coccineum]
MTGASAFTIGWAIAMSHSRLGQRRSSSEVLQVSGLLDKGKNRKKGEKKDSRRKRLRRIRITPNPDLIKDRPTFVSTDWRHPWDRALRTLPKSRMTKQGNFTQRTPQAKKQSDQASKQISKQASGSTNAPHDLVFRLNFTQRKKCAKNPVELARVKQRQGESTSVYVERRNSQDLRVYEWNK